MPKPNQTRIAPSKVFDVELDKLPNPRRREQRKPARFYLFDDEDDVHGEGDLYDEIMRDLGDK